MVLTTKMFIVIVLNSLCTHKYVHLVSVQLKLCANNNCRIMEMLEHQAEGQKVHSPPVPLIAAPTSYKQLTVTLRTQWAVHYSMKTDTITNAAQYKYNVVL